MSVPNQPRSPCPVACTLDIVGDKWSLLLIRDLVAGKRRYGEFRASWEKIPTNILADRLKRLESAGVIDKALYQEHPPRWEYTLTERGRELALIVKAMAVWGIRHLEGTELRYENLREAVLRDVAAYEGETANGKEQKTSE